MPQSVVPSPEQLILYAGAGEHIPLAIVRARTEAAKMEYRYAMAGVAIAGIGLVSVVGGFIFSADVWSSSSRCRFAGCPDIEFDNCLHQDAAYIAVEGLASALAGQKGSTAL